MERRYPSQPLVGVGAVIFRGDSVLIARRGTPPSYGEWSVPGGLVEVGESLEEALRREVMEEVGIEVEVGDLTAVLDRILTDAGGRIEYHYILMDFCCEWKSGEPMAATDVMDCRFVPVDALDGFVMTRGTAEVVRRAHAGRRGGRGPVYDAAL